MIAKMATAKIVFIVLPFALCCMSPIIVTYRQSTTLDPTFRGLIWNFSQNSCKPLPFIELRKMRA